MYFKALAREYYDHCHWVRFVPWFRFVYLCSRDDRRYLIEICTIMHAGWYLVQICTLMYAG